MSKEIIKLALEALKKMVYLAEHEGWEGFDEQYKAIEALEEELKQEQDEPVAYIRVSKTGNVMACVKSKDFFALPNGTLLYTTPQPRKPLTDEIPKSVLLAISNADMTLLKRECGYELRKLGPFKANHDIKE